MRDEVECARCGYKLKDADSFGDGEVGDFTMPSFCSRACYDAGVPSDEPVKVEIDDTHKHTREWLPCGCGVDYVPPNSGAPACIEIAWCDAHKRAEGLEVRVENLDGDVAELREEIAINDDDRAEMLDRLGMTEHEWTFRRTWVGQPTLASVSVMPVKRRRRKA